MRRARVALALRALLVTFVALLVSSAAAEPRRSAVALVTVGAQPELQARIRAEIGALGWRVKEISPGGDVALAQIARRARTLAVLRVAAGAEGIELWVAPEVDAQARSEWIDIDPRRPELAVLRAIESLRARFLELGIEPESSAGSETPESAATPSSEAAAAGGKPRDTKPEAKANATQPTGDSAPPEPIETGAVEGDGLIEPPGTHYFAPVVWFGLGGGVVQATNSSTPQVTLAGSVRLQAFPHVVANLEAWLPLSAVTLESGARSADVRSSLFGAALEYRAEAKRLQFGAGIGCAFALILARGNSNQNFVGKEARFYAAVPFGRLFSQYALSRQLYARIEASVGLSAPRPVIELERDQLGSYWAQPLLSGMLGLEWAPFVD